MPLLILYLIGAAITFAYLAIVKEERYEVVLFMSVFYPIVAVMLLLSLIALTIWATIWWIAETIKEWKRGNKNRDKNN